MNLEETKAEFFKILSEIDALSEERLAIEKKEEEKKRILWTIEEHLMNLLKENDLRGFITDDGQRCEIKTETYFGIVGEKKNEFIAKIVEENHGDILTVNKKTLRNTLEDFPILYEKLEGLISEYTEEYINVRKEKKK